MILLGGIFQQAMWDCLRVCNTSSIFKIEDKQSNLEVVYVPSKKRIWSSKSHSVGGSQLSGAFLSLPAAKCLLPLLWLRAFSSPHHWKSFQFQSPQLQTSLSGVSHPSRIQESHLGYSGIMNIEWKVFWVMSCYFTLNESWLKKRMNTRVIWEHRYISVFRWKIKKSLETSETYFQQIWIFPHYCWLHHCTSVDIWNSDDILTFVVDIPRVSLWIHPEIVGFRSEILVLLDYVGLALFLAGAPVGVWFHRIL